jgi:hypothetical protein
VPVSTHKVSPLPPPQWPNILPFHLGSIQAPTNGSLPPCLPQSTQQLVPSQCLPGTDLHHNTPLSGVKCLWVPWGKEWTQSLSIGLGPQWVLNKLQKGG